MIVRCTDAGSTRTSTTATAGPDGAVAASDASSAAGVSAKPGVRSFAPRRPPAVYNRDVIPSPKNSPLKTCAPLDQYLRSNKPASH